MFCCACNGSCNHVGPHSYCVAHGGQPLATLTTTASPNTVHIPSVWIQPCEHCWCITADEGIFPNGSLISSHAVGPHRQCCKCQTIMAEEFAEIPERVR